VSEQQPERRTHVIAVANQKGGVGKTTNTINIASALGELGNRSLIIDLDMTAGATKALGAPTSGWVSTFELLTGEEPTECIIDEAEEEVPLPRGIHLVPSSRKLSELDAWLAQRDNRWVNALDLLLGPVEKLRGRYDFVFLDTPPQITVTSLPAFKAADYVLLSAVPERLAVDGLADALTDIRNAQRAGNAKLRLLGVVMCAFAKNRTRLATELIHYIDEHVRDPQGRTLRFDTEVYRTVAIQEAQRASTSIIEYKADHPAAEQYRALARELIARIAADSKAELTPASPPSQEATSGTTTPGEVAANA